MVDLPAPTGLPARPALRPGLRVVRRDDRHLQVGIDPPLRAIVPDEAPVRRLLEDLSAGDPGRPIGPSDSPAAARCLQTLHQHGLLVDAAALDRALASGEDRAAAAAVFAQAGAGAEEVLTARTGSAVRVDAAPDVRQSAHRLLRAAGVSLTEEPEARDRAPGVPGAAAPGRARPVRAGRAGARGGDPGGWRVHRRAVRGAGAHRLPAVRRRPPRGARPPAGGGARAVRPAGSRPGGAAGPHAAGARGRLGGPRRDQVRRRGGPRHVVGDRDHRVGRDAGAPGVATGTRTAVARGATRWSADHQCSLSSFASIARRCWREQASQ